MEENQKEQQPVEIVSPGSDVDMIEVSTPNFFARHFLHLLAVFGAGFLIFWFIFNVYLTPIAIKGESMQPTINKDSAYSDIVYYRQKDDYVIGDILIIDAHEYLSDLDSSIIKRLIAKQGQKVSFEIYSIQKNVYTTSKNYIKVKYRLLIDDELLQEDYIAEQECYLSIYTDRLTDHYISSDDYVLLKAIFDYINEQTLGNYAVVSETNKLVYSFTLADDEFFACGDNRNHSTDCRYFGPIKTEAVEGALIIHVAHGQNFLQLFWKFLFSK